MSVDEPSERSNTCDTPSRTGWLPVYREGEQEREDVAQFDLNTVRHYEYVVEE